MVLIRARTVTDLRAAAARTYLVFLAALVCGNILVRMQYRGQYVPEPYSFLIVLVPPFPLAYATYRLAEFRRRPKVAA